MATASKLGVASAVGGGLVAGIVGGVAVAIFRMFLSALAQRDIWTWVKAAGIPLMGDRATRPGLDAGAVLAGALAHLVVSVFWGITFGILFHGLTRGLTVLAGIMWGLTAWLVMFYLALPAMDVTQVVRTTPVALAVFQHVVFGMSVAAGFLPFQSPTRPRVPVMP